MEIEAHLVGLFLHQTAYAKDILHQAAMSNCNSITTPLPQQIGNLDSELFSEPTYFQGLAEKLQYLTITRPDSIRCQLRVSKNAGSNNILLRSPKKNS